MFLFSFVPVLCACGPGLTYDRLDLQQLMGAGASTEVQQAPLFPPSAGQKKEQGNTYFQEQSYLQAELCYSESIALVNASTHSTERNAPTTVATLWSNRSAARGKLLKHGEALSDALVAITLRPRWFKAYFRAGQAAAALQQWQLAREYLLRAHILTNGGDATVNTLLAQAQTKRPVGIQDGPGSLLLWGQLPTSRGGQQLIQRPKYVDHLRGKFITEVAAGAMHTLALTPHGIYAWGANTNGQCGIGVTSGETQTCIEYPQLIPSLLGIQINSISCGVGHSCAIDSRGVLFSWGIGAQGQLGLGERVQCVPTPTAVLSLRNDKHRVRAVSCGIAHTFCVTTRMDTEEKCVLSFGWNHCGQLGHGESLSSAPTLQPPRAEDTVLTPTLVVVGTEEGDGDPVQQVACGGAHTVCVTRSGRMFVTGSGSCGQLGLGEIGSSISTSTTLTSATATTGTVATTATSVGAISTFQEIPSRHLGGRKIAFACAGEEFTCLVTKGDHEVFVMGLGNKGQLGDGCSFNRNIPTVVQEMSGKGTISLVSGKTSTMALTEEGEIWVWGGGNEDNPIQCMEQENSTTATAATTFRLPQLLSGVRKKRVRQLEIGRSHFCSLLYATSPEQSYLIFPTKKNHEQESEEENENAEMAPPPASMAVVPLGRRYKFQVQAVDDGGKDVLAGCDQFHVLAVEEASGGMSFADATLDDNFDGTYACSIQPKVSGLFSVQVQLFGIHIVGSPFELNVVEKEEIVTVKVVVEKEQAKKEEDVTMQKRRELMAVLRRQEMTRRRAKEALLRVQRERKADEKRELRRKKQKRCGGGFVVSFDNADAEILQGRKGGKSGKAWEGGGETKKV